ncbi:MAG: restriction endonuclease subunit S, partial [Azonexus sp.]
AREQLKVYRQSLLKNAFEGKLTAAWRTAHRDQLETATALQQRIAHERQARYQQQLADLQTAGQSGPKPKPPKPLLALTAEEFAELPELPAGWEWFKLADVADISGGLTKNQKRELLSMTRPYLRVANVYANRLELNEVHNIGVTESELGRVALEKGDLLIVEGNGSIDQIGRVALWGGQIAGCVHQNHLIKARPLKQVAPKFLLYFLMSEIGRKFIVRAASSTSGLHTLSISKVEGLFVPHCFDEEQAEVVAELESKLSEADQLDQTLATALQQADALRQSILKKAFHGQLVKQDKNEEPATALLERIRAEKSNGIKKPSKQRKSG